jgi:hypothetical protein
VKEFVQDQEDKGNTVLLPKMNEDIIVIKELHTNLIKVYSIKHRQFVRQFSLRMDQNFLAGSNHSKNTLANVEHNSSQVSNISLVNNHTSKQAIKVISSQNVNEPEVKEEQESTKKDNVLKSLFLENSKTSKANGLNTGSSESSLDCLNQVEGKGNVIGMVEVSPKGRFIVAQIDDDIFLRVIHLTLTAQNEKFKNSYDYQ